MKIFTMPIYFFRELIFDSKEEYNIHSTSFNTRKVLTFLIMVVSICLNIAVTIRLVAMAVEIVGYKETISKLEEAYKPPDTDPDKKEDLKRLDTSETPSTASTK